MRDVRRVAILGSTGSIGVQTLDVISKMGDTFEVFAITAGKNLSLLAEQVEKFQPSLVCIVDEGDADVLRNMFPAIEVLCGDEGLCAVAADERVDVVVNAVVGSAGLMPSWAAVSSGKRLCTANKESLVMAGELLMSKARETDAQVFPIDSEHSALWQAMLSGKRSEIKRLILTASGGPFWNADVNFDEVSPEQALTHPNWSMGTKITIDSATMMNKALEIIEARWLFDIPPERIDVLIHPQSIVHSIVEFIDGSQIAQMSIPDMRLPIQYALTYPSRMPSAVKPLELHEIGKLEFYKPDLEKYPSISLAYEALRRGGTAPIVLNAANEVAVEMFLEGRIKFSQIYELVSRALNEVESREVKSVEEIVDYDIFVRGCLISMIDGMF